MRVFLPFLVVMMCSGSFAQNQQTDDILEKLSKRPFDRTALGAVMKSQDPSLFRPALRKAFEETNEKAIKQAIARTIVELGDPTPEYFDYLAQFALEAVRSTAPAVLAYDEEGRSVRGKVSPEFEIWCRGQGLDVLQEAGKQIMVYPSDLFELAKTRDPRAADILRQGLESKNPTLVAIAASGLAWQQDIVSIPRIVAASRRFSVNDIGFSLAGALAEYNGDSAQKQILSAMGDPKLRGMYMKSLQRKRQRALTGPR